MLFFAPCKINLGLHVVAKRPDGYHNLETIFYPVPFYDIVEIIPAAELKDQSGQYKSGLYFTTSGLAINDPDNLCIKAYQSLAQQFQLPATRIHLHKSIPIGAGLGGGSSDAASVLKGIVTVYNLQTDSEQLKAQALSVGSDCPFFLGSQPALASGRGETLQKTDAFIKHHHITIIKPSFNISTAEAYKSVTPKASSFNLGNLPAMRIEKWQDVLFNDFEEPLFKLYPQLAEIKKQLYQCGALYASLSGSGSAVYAISYSKLETGNNFNNCFIWQCVL